MPLNTPLKCCVCEYQFEAGDYTIREVDSQGLLQWVKCEICYERAHRLCDSAEESDLDQGQAAG